ncbi:molybdopterin molybdotransferase MoeA [Allopontixanthobacter sp.]|uniref:molybdopterin molybdotransferase MoeA n=1 Tax=Allopontixanthobacter sp. TaxID=2906452 RepID=UPI002ABAE451|nr:molybdopterin molybdotransferase MoeA [Allopontixanthobacter sp.]MDZ4308145.1 molybdopterin molybdotransferase MoeA [Allopontixanthobacter sp.]
MVSLVPFNDALKIVLAEARPLPAEDVPVTQAHNRTLAKPILARIASPRVDSSAMDGYAVRDQDVGRLPAKLRVRGESFAGTARPPAIIPGEAVRIFTGAPVPDGADRVVVQENCTRVDDMVEVREYGTARHIRPAGLDFEEGAELLTAGARLTPRALVAAAGADIAVVSAVRRPRVAILGTGDELVPPGEARQRPGTIPESISPAIAAMIVEAGGEVVQRVHLPDEVAVLADWARDALVEADLVVVTGGASVGERDYAKAMFGEMLDLLFSKVAIKPGKPVWFGRLGPSLVLGLPGNPTSALVTARLFLVPLVSGLAGRSPASALNWQGGIAGAPFPANGSRETLERAKWVGGRLVRLKSQDSSSQTMLANADVLVRREVGAPEVLPGETVRYLDF